MVDLGLKTSINISDDIRTPVRFRDGILVCMEQVYVCEGCNYPKLMWVAIAAN